MEVARGQIWLVGTRPCLIVSPDEVHDHVSSVIVAPLTSKSRSKAFRVPIEFQDRSGYVLLEQVRSVSLKRLRRLLGTASGETRSRVLQTLQELFAE